MRARRASAPGPAAAAGTVPGAIDRDRLQAALLAAARERRPLTYRVLLAHLGLRHGSGNVARVCRILGEIDRDRVARAEPELACLVVRQADGLPGEGYWAADPEAGTASRAVLIRARQERAFAWAARRGAARADPLDPSSDR